MDKSLYSTISVVLTTYNRKEVLEKALKAYFKQDYLLDRIEIVIADDGSTDGTDYLMAEIQKSSPIMIKYLRQKNQGISLARNLGIKNSQNEIIFLSDDDIIPEANLIKEHMAWHNLYPKREDAILGYFTWSPEVKIDDFMRWCENGGPLFQYHLIESKTEVDCRFFYGGNISLKADFLQENLFDQNFYFGFDDFEIGYRLSKKGLKIYYNKAAAGYHYKSISYAEVQRRFQVIGKAAWQLHQKWPATKEIVKVRNIWVLKAAKLVAGLLYPLAKILKWRKVVYHFKYQNRLSQILARSYRQAQIESMRTS